jgi:hypothetical protein
MNSWLDFWIIEKYLENLKYWNTGIEADISIMEMCQVLPGFRVSVTVTVLDTSYGFEYKFIFIIQKKPNLNKKKKIKMLTDSEKQT